MESTARLSNGDAIAVSHAHVLRRGQETAKDMQCASSLSVADLHARAYP
jgi:hypothetical protein